MQRGTPAISLPFSCCDALPFESSQWSVDCGSAGIWATIVAGENDESVFRLVFSEMPLATDRSGITGLVQSLRQSSLVQRQSPRRAGTDDGVNASMSRVTTCHHAGSCGRTDWLNIERFHNRSLTCERIDLRCVDFLSAHETAIRPAKIIDEQIDDVWSWRFFRKGDAGQKQKR